MSRNVPKRRFKEFEDDEYWEHKKLKNVAKFAKGQGYSKSDLTNEGTPIILYGRLYTKYQSAISRVDTFTIPKSESVYSTGKEVIVPASGETSEDIARAAAVVESGVLIGGDLNIIYPSKDIDNVFLALLISNGEQKKELSKKAQGKSVVHLHNSDLEDIKIPVPAIDEQKKIGSAFKNIDKIISAQQNKLEKIRNLKKAYLNQLFPMKGESKANLRFAGFTNEWEQSKLGEITNTYSGGTPSVGVKEYYNGNIPFIRSGDINRASTEVFITEQGLSNSSAKLVSKGDILYALYGATSGEVGIAKYEGAINQAILAIQPMANYNAQYIMQWLRKEKQNIVDNYIQGGQGNLSGTIIKELIIDLPEYDEQVKIGRFLTGLDNLIEIQHLKIEKLKNIKKAYLKEMFI